MEDQLGIPPAACFGQMHSERLGAMLAAMIAAARGGKMHLAHAHCDEANLLISKMAQERVGTKVAEEASATRII